MSVLRLSKVLEIFAWMHCIQVQLLFEGAHMQCSESAIPVKAVWHDLDVTCTAWCSEIGCLWSLDAPELHASVTSENQCHCARLYSESETWLGCMSQNCFENVIEHFGMQKAVEFGPIWTIFGHHYLIKCGFYARLHGVRRVIGRGGKGGGVIKLKLCGKTPRAVRYTRCTL